MSFYIKLMTISYLVTYSPTPSFIKKIGSAGWRGAKPLSKVSSPSPFKERGIKGVRSINNL